MLESTVKLRSEDATPVAEQRGCVLNERYVVPGIRLRLQNDAEHRIRRTIIRNLVAFYYSDIVERPPGNPSHSLSSRLPREITTRRVKRQREPAQHRRRTTVE